MNPFREGTVRSADGAAVEIWLSANGHLADFDVLISDDDPRGVALLDSHPPDQHAIPDGQGGRPQVGIVA